ncbi:hypothetical protein ALQ32_200075 [Pseudomonas syringae pv. tagetis]|uniref:Uncharacterized protein n=1 Tax=Pseudomonas syringae pv. tagetis TaxID=129140 RepID=A0A3M3ZHW5_9PSED|nr:hypothetical protein ALQ32_200075 [Pseudomonas syringae pv. tagetis]
MMEVIPGASPWSVVEVIPVESHRPVIEVLPGATP